jgi:hypothetical protein
MSNPFQGLDSILAALCPRHGGDKQAAELEPDAPERIQQIWRALGLSELTRGLSVRPRTRAESEKELLPFLQRWSETPKSRAVWGESVEAIRKALPERLRVVQAASDEKLTITDESAGLVDPPVVQVQSESRRVLRYCDTYSEWLIWRLVRTVAQTRLAAYNRLAELPSKRIVDDAYPPGMYQLADRIWWMEMPKFDPEAELPPIQTTVFYASLEDYSAYVFSLPEEKRAFMRTPHTELCWLRAPGPLDLTEGTPEGFRPMTSVGFDGRPEKAIRAIGRVGAWFVWLGMVARGDIAVGFDPAARAEVSGWLESLGLKVKQTIPLDIRLKGKSVGHDYFGW